MKLIINIPDDLYGQLLNKKQRFCSMTKYEIKIANGTPLPKGHGRLIDVDALDINIQQYYESQLNNSYAKAFVEFMAFVDTVPTIIEADKE